MSKIRVVSVVAWFALASLFACPAKAQTADVRYINEQLWLECFDTVADDGLCTIQFTVEDVIAISPYLPPSVISVAIAGSTSKFKLTGKILLELDAAGVHRDVIDTMVKGTFPERFRKELPRRRVVGTVYTPRTTHVVQTCIPTDYGYTCSDHTVWTGSFRPRGYLFPYGYYVPPKKYLSSPKKRYERTYSPPPVTPKGYTNPVRVAKPAPKPKPVVKPAPVKRKAKKKGGGR